MTNLWLQCVLYLVILTVLAIPLGAYIGKVMDGEKVMLSRILLPCERGVYRLLRLDPAEEMSWKKYGLCAVCFSGIGFLALYLILILQGSLPLNPAGLAGNSWHLAFNTTASFVSNTNWQSYSGETTLSYFSQIIGLTVQN
ncbi:MAG: potassium-transporting ATPase subunit KdpA, partial [Clostridiales bacterium]